jgi:hypothetical protein
MIVFVWTCRVAAHTSIAMVDITKSSIVKGLRSRQGATVSRCDEADVVDCLAGGRGVGLKDILVAENCSWVLKLVCSHFNLIVRS